MNGLRLAITTCILAITTVNSFPMTAARFEIRRVGQVSKQNNEGEMARQVKEFFLRFEEANASSDVSALGNLYSDSFMFGGPKGVQAVKKADFLRMLPNLKTRLYSLGLSETKLQTVDAKSLDSRYVLATVVWRMSLGKSPQSKHFDASSTYILLRGQDDALSIVLQIDHQDLQALLRGIEPSAPSSSVEPKGD